MVGFILYIVIYLAFIILPLVMSARKRVLVFYDLSDFLFTFVLYFLLGALGGFMVYAPNSFMPVFWIFQSKCCSPILRGVGPVFWYAYLFVFVTFIAHSFSAAYLYNKPRPMKVFISFLGRIAPCHMIFSISFITSYIADVGFRVSFKGFAEICGIPILFLILCFIYVYFLIYKRAFSKIDHFINFKYMNGLGKEFRNSMAGAKKP